jgi:hypothetical protein
MQLKQIIKETLIINDLKRTIEKESNYVPFQKLPYNQKLRISFMYISEINKMASNNILSEQIDLNTIANFVTNNKAASTVGSGLGQTAIEWMIKKIAGRLGIKEGLILDTIVNYFLDNPMDVVKSFKDCNLMTKKIIEAMTETLMKKVIDKNILGSTNVGTFAGGVIRNSLMELMQNAEWERLLMAKFTPVVCKYKDEMLSSVWGKFFK